MGHTTLDPVSSLFSDAWDLYVERCGVLTEIMLSPVILLLASDILRTQGQPFSLVAGILVLAGWVLFLIAYGGVVYSLGHNAGVDESYGAGSAIFFSLFWVAILAWFTVVGGTVMLVIPGILLSIALTFSNFTLVLEGKRGLQSLFKSYAYVKGYWWAVLGRVVLLAICMLVLYALVGVPFAILFGSSGSQFASTLLMLVVIPFSLSFYYTIYKNLVALKPHTHPDHAVSRNKFIVVAAVVGVIALVAVILIVVLAARAHGFQ